MLISCFIMQIHANCRIRRVYFSDRLYSEDELPAEFKLYLPVQNKAPVKVMAACHEHVTRVLYVGTSSTAAATASPSRCCTALAGPATPPRELSHRHVPKLFTAWKFNNNNIELILRRLFISLACTLTLILIRIYRSRILTNRGTSLVSKIFYWTRLINEQ